MWLVSGDEAESDGDEMEDKGKGWILKGLGPHVLGF